MVYFLSKLVREIIQSNKYLKGPPRGQKAILIVNIWHIGMYVIFLRRQAAKIYIFRHYEHINKKIEHFKNTLRRTEKNINIKKLEL